MNRMMNMTVICVLNVGRVANTTKGKYSSKDLIKDDEDLARVEGEQGI
jgi:hypothetical protein